MSEWPNTDDAMVWAEQFEAHKKRNEWTVDEIGIDLMLGWFANAIENAHDKRMRENKEVKDLQQQLIESERLLAEAKKKCWCKNKEQMVLPDGSTKPKSGVSFAVEDEREDRTGQQCNCTGIGFAIGGVCGTCKGKVKEVDGEQ